MANPLLTSSVREFTLPGDADLPPEQRRTFVYRYPSAALYFEFLQARKVLANLIDNDTEYAKAAGPIAGMLMAGWRNVTSDDEKILTAFGLAPSKVAQPLPFKPELLYLVVGAADVDDFVSTFAEEVALNGRVKKPSGSPSGPTPDSSPQAPA